MVRERLCTSSTADKHEVDNALMGLRRMARLGRMAERALRQLAESGSCDKAPILTASVRDLWGSAIRFESFRPFKDVTRDDVPNYGSYELKFTSYPSQPHLAVHLIGSQIAGSLQGEAVVVPIPHLLRLALITFHKNGPSAEVIERGFSMKSKKHRTGLERSLAVRASELIVNGRASRFDVRFNEIESRVVHWLLEDGFPSRWVDEMIKVTLVTDVMST